MDGPATNISAPESGRILRLAQPLRDETWMLIVGACSPSVSNVVVGAKLVVFMSGVVGGWDKAAGRCPPWQTLAR